ncbi:RHS repeat-associated core domain-containing protein, partial [Pantoea endophytica]
MATLTPLAPALVAPVREAMPYGIWEREQSEDGRWLYVRYDGHQRPLSRWLQRVPGDDHADSNRVCIERVAYGADGTVAGSHVFDYLPGGLCERIIDAVRPPHKAESWFWQAENSRVTQSVDKLTGALTVTRLQGRMDGTVTGSTVTTQTNLPDGRVRFESESRAGEPENSGQSKPGMLQARTRQETDSRGRLVKLTESVETVMISKGEETRKWKERDWALTYDDLGRRTTVTAPDGRVVTWAYEGLCDVPTGITLKQGAKGKPLPLGSRTLPSGDGVASLTRGKGATEWYTEKGRIRADGTTLYALEDEKDHTLTVYREKDKEKSALATFRINPATLVLRNVRLAGKDQQLEVVNESLTPALLGEYRLDRIVAGITARAQGMASLRGRVTSGRSTSGVPSAGRPTPQGMPQRVRRGELEYRYQWTPEGQCAQAAVRDLRTGHCLVADYRYDFAGNETERRYSLGDTTGVKEMVRWEQAWTSQGQLRTAALYRRDVLTRTETFTYETQESGLRDELINWAVSVQIPGTDEVCDRDGRAIRLQAYTYDTLGNMTGCSTRFADEQTETRTYAYGDADQPSRRTQERVTSSGATTSHALSYDMAGNLMASGPRYFTYTAEGQLASAGEGGILLTRYDYDANGALTATWDAASMTTRILTGDAEMCLDSQGQPVSRRIDDTEAGLVTVCQVLSGKEGETVSAEMLYFTLAAPGTCGGDEWWVDERGDWHYRSAAFTPWGESAKHSLDSMASGLGWNRMNADAAGLYHMGGGYRAYDPCERTFCQPDGLSPFGAGGLNDRAYCAYRDPVNWHDPSGHVMLNRFAVREQLATLDQWISETTLPSPKAAAWWEWVLLGAGALAFVVAMVMSGGALAAILPGIVGLIGIGAKGVGMAMRQGEPELAAKMEFTGDILSADGGLQMPMTGEGAVTSALLRTA